MRCFLKGIVVLMVLGLSLSASAQRLDYVNKRVSLNQLFKELREQTGYHVIWNEQKLNADRLIDADFKNADLKDVMERILRGLPLTYVIRDKVIIIKEKTIEEQRLRLSDTLSVHDLKEVEIVSTGYQLIPKQQATGSFSLISPGQFERRVSPDVFSRLEGIASGLLFNKNTLLSASGGLDLSVRGRSTIYANDQPLVILDNFPFSGDFNAINPNDVAGITLLKDAAAASIWGVRAGNGVIVINTKRGKYKQPLQIIANSNLTISGKPDVFYNPNYMSASDYIDVETFLFKNGKYDQDLEDQMNYPVISPVVQLLYKERLGQQSSAETDRQLDLLRERDVRNEELKYFYRSKVAQQYAVSLSGGTAFTNHYFSAGYDHENGSRVGNHNQRVTLNSQNTFQLLKRLEMDAGINYIYNLVGTDNTLTEASDNGLSPYSRLKDEAGNPAILDRNYSSAFKKEALSRGFQNWDYLPLQELGKFPANQRNDDLRLNTGLKYTLVPGLSAVLRYQYQQIKSKSELYQGLENYQTRNVINQYSILTGDRVSGYNIPLAGITYFGNGKVESNSFRAQLTYQQDWERHSVSAIAGYEVAQLRNDWNRDIRYGGEVDTVSFFDLNPSGSAPIGGGFRAFGKLDRILSWYGNATYTYDHKYTFYGSMRRDGSNYFGINTNQKKVPLWSAGLLWSLDKEAFYNLEWLPVFKLRVSYGLNGNLDKESTGVTTFRYNAVGAAFTNLVYANLLNIGNPDLSWEKIAITNMGIEFGSRNNVLSGKIEYFIKNGSDIIGDKAFASNTGITSLRGNYADVKSRGVDVSLSSRNINGNLKWRTDFFFSAVKDRVTKYDVIESKSIYYLGTQNLSPLLDKPVYGIYSYKWAGLDPDNGDPRGYLNGEVSKDYAAIINTTSVDDLDYHGAARPTVFGSIANTFSYKRVTLGFNISYKLGYYFRKPSVNYYGLYNLNIGGNMNSDFRNRWKVPGDENTTNIPSMGEYTSDSFRDAFYNGSSATVGRGDHIRIQDISLSVDLNPIWLSNGIKGLQLYCYAANLGLIWKANDFGLDPDLIPQSGRLLNPVTKSFAVGLRVGL